MDVIKTCLERLSKRKDLDYQLSKQIFDRIFENKVSPIQTAAFLMGLSVKKETEDEILGAVDVALDKAKKIKGLGQILVDTCGTGGDGKKSFNCSTAVAFFLADMGIQVVKHGNRAVSSTCGSADIVEALGLPIVQEESLVQKELEKRNFVFLFAPYFHPCFANVAPIRKELGVRTLFNLIGPLLNPAFPTHQIIGVPNQEFLPLVARVLAKKKNIKKGCVVYGAKGFDELTPCGVNKIYFVENGSILPFELNPADYGFPIVEEEKLICSTKEEAILLQKQVLSGRGPKELKAMVALNLGCVLYLLKGKDLGLCFQEAREKVNTGINRLFSEEQLC
ncbi:anthranilate phosphoribosyltransferase [Desulfonauticus submarinus]